jgi:hypothetical protein
MRKTPFTELKMIQLIYVSASVRPFSAEELTELLQRSRQNNEKLGITGMLLYKDGNFMQGLEGEENAVRALAARIAKDPRHKDFATLLEKQVSEREFPDWSMGFHNLTGMDPMEVPGYSTFLDSPLRVQDFKATPSNARSLLLLFKSEAQAR